MPRSSRSSVPTYRHHKPSGQAVVTLNDRDHYLGTWNTPSSRREYDRLIGEWLAGGRQIHGEAESVTVAELCLAYWRFAKGYYRKDGQPTRSIERVKLALRPLRRAYGPSSVAEFGPLKLQALQQSLVRDGKGRKYVNYLVAEIKRAFKWGVSQEIVPANIFHGLSTVASLRKGRTEAPESQPVLPVPDDLVDATMPFLPPVVADMVRFQQLTGCRPGEACMIRPRDLDRTDDVWAYRPQSHKTEHHGRERVIIIGPQAQEVLRPYLLRSPDSYCFVPAESERKRREAVHAKRKTQLCCGNRPGSNHVRRRKRQLSDRYDSCSYARAVKSACDRADDVARKADTSVPTGERIVPRWSPNRLRHSMATKVRKEFGLEAVQVVLGHATANVTQIYAERDLTLAAQIMCKIG